MRMLKIITALLIIVLLGCESSINGPVGSDLTYEPQLLSVGEEVRFGTIGEDVIKVKFAGLDGNSYILEHSANMCAPCPLRAEKTRVQLVMCEGKYKVTFNYYSTDANNLVLQLYKYERL